MNYRQQNRSDLIASPFLKNSSILLFLSLLISLAVVTGSTGTQSTPTVAVDLTPTSAPTATSTPVPLGHPDNPISIGLVVRAGNPDIEAAINTLLEYLNTNSTVTIAIQVYPGDQELYDALKAGLIQAAWLQPLTYIMAHDNNLVDVSWLTNHFGTYFYGTQFLANAESGFIPYFDPVANRSTADLITALAQFDGRRPCWVEPGSISGYILHLVSSVRSMSLSNRRSSPKPTLPWCAPCTLRVCVILGQPSRSQATRVRPVQLSLISLMQVSGSLLSGKLRQLFPA